MLSGQAFVGALATPTRAVTPPFAVCKQDNSVHVHSWKGIRLSAYIAASQES
jgi:hypothetical protein